MSRLYTALTLLLLMPGLTSPAQNKPPAAINESKEYVITGNKAIRKLPVTIAEYNQFLQDIKAFWRPGFENRKGQAPEQLRQTKTGNDELYLQMLPESSLIPDSTDGRAYYELVDPASLLYPAEHKIEYYIFMPQMQHLPITGIYPRQMEVYCQYKADMLNMKTNEQAKLTCRPARKDDWQSLPGNIPQVAAYYGQDPKKDNDVRIYYFQGYTELLDDDNSIYFEQSMSLDKAGYQFTIRGYPDLQATFRYVLEWE